MLFLCVYNKSNLIAKNVQIGLYDAPDGNKARTIMAEEGRRIYQYKFSR
jgi:hypothetical protein